MTTPYPRDRDASESNANVAAMMSPVASECAKADGRSGDTTPGTKNARPMKRKLCSTRIGRNASALGRALSFGQMYCFATVPHATRLKAMLMKKHSCGDI